ncbi:polycomb protein Pcl [Condylostylus longicornis]|uniref:polycomb protein Pcl n=1 Tax=Condylostylus longicornis TaxID=2530218 RepID=UPI00244E41C9|nr:polycomb protein Pcl [Condylostylus longicornis]XP_055371555.1 polycomb protein Pcl [Condylostylus longicornis]
MSNLENNLQRKPPVNFCQDKNQQSPQEINLSNSCHEKIESTFNSNKTGNFLNGNSAIKTEIHEKQYYSHQSDSEETSTPGSNTILITTHSYSPRLPAANTKHLNNNKSSSSSITIVTTHNSSGSVSATTTTNNGSTTSIKSTSGDCIPGSYQNSLNGHTSANSPVVLEGINILINNHFNEPSSSNVSNNSNESSNKNIDLLDQKNRVNSSTSATEKEANETIKSEKSDIQTEPDSTTNGLSPDKSLTLKNSVSNSDTGFGSSSTSSFCSSHSSSSSCISNESTNNYKPKVYNFAANMDVLVQKKDGKFYLGTIKDVYAVDGKCMINFDDSSEYLADFDELKRLSCDSEIESSPMCVVCKKFNENDIVESCEKCSRGYHRMCAESGFRHGIWTCKMCCAENGLRTAEERNTGLILNRPFKNKQLQFPYDIQSLTWDSKHRINNQEIYCYCGKHGRWDDKMLQCLKCLQWFHEKCIQSLSYPLLYGDRFYVFVCSICNHGTEVVRRLKFGWIDLVHLIMFNLTKLENDKKYHHITKTIAPYAIQNWSNFQLSVSMNNLSQKEIQKKIVNVLNNSSRFKSGKETKKGFVFWGLRTLIPPSLPKIAIPKGATKITDQFLKSVLKLKFLSPTKKSKNANLESEEDAFIDDNESKFSSDLKFSSEDEIPIKNMIEKELGTIKREVIDSKTALSSPMEPGQKEQKEQSRRKKKHTFFPRLSNPLIIKSDTVTNFNNNVNISNNNINEKSVGLTVDLSLCCDSSDDNSSLGPLDLRIPPPKNFFGRNNPFRHITPKKMQDNSSSYTENNSSSTKNFNTLPSKLNLNSMHSKCCINDVSKSIDLSSKLVALKKSSVNLFNSRLPTDFQAAGQFRIVRTIKRRLSAKDLVIGPNQEIKKRRLRRSSGSSNVEVISTSIQSVSSSKSKNNIIATYPVGTPFNFNSISGLKVKPIFNKNMPSTVNSLPGSVSGHTISNTPLATSPILVDSSNPFSSFSNMSNVQNLKHRSLRKRDDKNYAENRRNSSSSANSAALTYNSSMNAANNNYNSNNTCNIISGESSRNNSFEQSTEDELSDLQSSVNMYFGAVERIRNGEKFIVRGKRTLTNGKIQYLMEWEGCSQIWNQQLNLPGVLRSYVMALHFHPQLHLK